MSRVLVLYGTSDGHTAKVAGAIAEALREEGCLATVVETLRRHAVTPWDYDAVIVAASVHAGGYQRPVRRWVRHNAYALSHLPTAFVSVCLGILEHKPEVDRQLQAIVRRFLASTGWQPGQIRMVAGALRYTRYGWFKKIVMRRIAAKTGGGTDTTRDYDYTDWEELRGFTQAFARDNGLVPEQEAEEATV